MAKLVLLLGDDRYVAFAVGERAVIGRASECDVQVVHPSVSRRHAEVRRADGGGGWIAEDLGGAGGIRVDGTAARGPTALVAGAVLHVGELAFVFEPPLDVAGDLDGERTVALVDDRASPPTLTLVAPASVALSSSSSSPSSASSSSSSLSSASGAASGAISRTPAVTTPLVAGAAISLGAHVEALALVAGGGRAALDALIAGVAARTGAERVIVMEQLADGRLRPLAIHGGDRGVAVSRTAVTRALAERTAFAVDDAIAEVAFARATSVFELGVRAVMVAPLVRGDTPIGVVIADHRRRGAFGAGALTELVAAAAALALVVGRGAGGFEAGAGAALESAHVGAPAPAPAWIGADRATLAVLAHADRVAAAGSRVLVTGESGTGKELIARRIHAASARAAGPWVALNCAALGEGVLDSELFGHEKGAFTGALRRKRGCFELADGGTLFLDEVGELAASTQAKLLRAIQDGRFFRVGGEQPIDVDVRVVAATNRDLRALAATGAFREDLYYRLAVITLELPPLRARGDDVVALTETFLAAIAAELGRPPPRLTAAAWQRWRAYAWPGNVRELRNAVERLVVLAELDAGYEIDVDALPAELQAVGPRAPGSLAAALGELERERIAAALAGSGGNKSAAARALGISRPTLDKKIREHGLTAAGGDA
jgi:transcriptional regulator with GAF, ATPase, and Fis domain